MSVEHRTLVVTPHLLQQQLGDHPAEMGEVLLYLGSLGQTISFGIFAELNEIFFRLNKLPQKSSHTMSSTLLHKITGLVSGVAMGFVTFFGLDLLARELKGWVLFQYHREELEERPPW